MAGYILRWSALGGWLLLGTLFLFGDNPKTDSGDRRGAAAVCQDSVKQRLFDSDSASFEANSVQAVADRRWQVTGSVSAVGPRGVVSAASYRCTVEYRGRKRWSVSDVAIVDR